MVSVQRTSREFSRRTVQRWRRRFEHDPTLRYAINTTLDGCCRHEAGLPPIKELMAFWTDELRRSEHLLYGRVKYERMEGVWRRPESGMWPDWMDSSEVACSEVVDPMRNAVAFGTLGEVDWNAELVRGDVVDAVRRLKEHPGRGIALGGVKLPATLAAHGLTDEYTFVVHPSSPGADHGGSMASGVRSTSNWSSNARSARAR